MTIQGVYETGPLKGLPRRGMTTTPLALEAIRKAPPSPLPHDVARLTAMADGWRERAPVSIDAYTYPGDPALTDEAIDAAAGLEEESEEERGVTGLAVLIFAAFAVAYFGLSILGAIPPGRP